MWIVAIAWLYVAVMMSLAEATSPQGTVLGALITFVFYGVGPLALVMYLMGARNRRVVRLKAEAEERRRHVASLAASAAKADGSGLPAGDAIAPEGKEP
ncbi:MAG TPA: hypothetical protein VFW93_13680 [Aquabacterium sp.]|uniref:hypothetical protein n=1 Tax=Aquabacterium sp. TaxID=1872578 RepID=UPI002E35F26E|nr:hypothetical protein [Aquabacterium sp.]HEX5357264.1 hypothetical protein [Aquabacterium sp.]